MTKPSRTPARIGRLFVVSGPSGVGKGTVVRRLLELEPNVALSISYTTRDPRPDEVDGRDYRFVSDQEFQRMIDAGGFLEWAEIFGDHRSGTPSSIVDAETQAGRDVVLEIDVQGAEQVRARRPGAVLVFLAPPEERELARRLRERRTESEDQLARRLATARKEMERAREFDHIVVNDMVDRAARQIARIIAGDRG